MSELEVLLQGVPPLWTINGEVFKDSELISRASMSLLHMCRYNSYVQLAVLAQCQVAIEEIFGDVTVVHVVDMTKPASVLPEQRVQAGVGQSPRCNRGSRSGRC